MLGLQNCYTRPITRVSSVTFNCYTYVVLSGIFFLLVVRFWESSFGGSPHGTHTPKAPRVCGYFCACIWGFAHVRLLIAFVVYTK